jgi:hypothetical protein
MTAQKRGFKRWVKVGVGWSLLIVGVAGLFLPVIQGLLCIASGLTLLSTEYRWAGACLEWVKRRLRRHKAGEAAPGSFVELSTSQARGEELPIDKA